VFAIFDRGMDVNHCNAIFIYNMIRTISGGIDAHGKSHSHRDQQNRLSHHEAPHDGCKKLNQLAACLDMIFGVNEEDSSDILSTAVSVSISKAERETSTVLKFSMSLESLSQSDETSLLTTQQPPAGTLPPHLQAMSQVFAQFSAENTRPLQSQLDSTRKTLAATREGSMDLQRQALKLQDDLQDAQTEAEEAKSNQEQTETELGRQKYEFERREESFERVKEHYKAEIDRKETELANAKERFERELKEAKAEVARAKLRYTGQRHSEQRHTEQNHTEQRHTEQRHTDLRHTEQRHMEQRHTEQRKRKERDGRREDHQMKDHRTEHHRRHGMPHPNPNANMHAETTETSDDQISPSIPRKIEYHPTDPFDDDAEGSRKTSKVSGRQSRHSTGNVTSRKSRSAPYELQPPRRSRASSEPKTRDTNHKTDQHHSSTSRNDEQVSESSGRYGQPGSTKQRNPLKSLTENSHADHSSDANFREKKESRNRRERSARNDQQPHDERAEQEESKQTSNFASSSKNRKATKNPYLKQSKPSKNIVKETDGNNEPSFAYQEVVRGRDKRQALPGHDCEECRKFLNAVGNGYDREQLVFECSRHRARHAPPSTPPDFWKLTFVDSVGGSQK